MKKFKDSIEDYVCTNGCGLSIFNAQKNYDKCPQCGGPLSKLQSDMEKLRELRSALAEGPMGNISRKDYKE